MCTGSAKDAINYYHVEYSFICPVVWLWCPVFLPAGNCRSRTDPWEAVEVVEVEVVAAVVEVAEEVVVAVEVLSSSCATTCRVSQIYHLRRRHPRRLQWLRSLFGADGVPYCAEIQNTPTHTYRERERDVRGFY